MPSRIERWLEDPLLARLYADVRGAGRLRSISVDLTEVCNLRCAGCYYFAEGMDAHASQSGAPALEAFIERERARGTNFVTVVGGEPSLALDSLKRLYDSFRLSVATNGLVRIPREGFEELPIGVSVWGAAETDRELRGGGRVDVFERALENYAGDPRAFFYYTVAPGLAHEVSGVVERCVEAGNRVLFNFYGDLEGRGGALDARAGFGEVRAEIERAIERHPEHVLMTAHLARVVSTGELFGRRWGHEVCTSVTFDHPVNAERVANGSPLNAHFRAYNADLESTRRCCTGVTRSCETCFDTWEHFSWVMLEMRSHLKTERDFVDWLSTTWLFYFINRIIDVDEGARLLPRLQRRALPSACALAR